MTCPSTKTDNHTAGCYKTMMTCGTPLHTHSGRACFTKDGDLKCSAVAHPAHDGVTCYSVLGPLCGGT